MEMKIIHEDKYISIYLTSLVFFYRRVYKSLKYPQKYFRTYGKLDLDIFVYLTQIDCLSGSLKYGSDKELLIFFFLILQSRHLRQNQYPFLSFYYLFIFIKNVKIILKMCFKISENCNNFFNQHNRLN